MATNELGAYLRARRDEVAPGDVGLPAAGPRRVLGLRREEVAILAGVSADYYVRLEQGRERHPSAQVLDALAATLRLDDEARGHLFRIAGLGAPARTVVGPEQVDPQLVALLEAWSTHPALVLGRAYDVLAANHLGRALFGSAGNLMEKVFCDPAARTFYADWPAAARSAVAGFRVRQGHTPHDPRLRAVLADLLAHSDEFARLWARHDAHGKLAERKRLVHPDVGGLDLHMQTFDVRSAPGQELVVYRAEPASVTEHNLALLGSLTVSTGPPPA